MGLTNINTLQKLAYTGRTEDLQKYSDIYLKQALANLGQRFSIKGDGVTNGKFALYELIPTLPVPIEEDFEDQGNLYDAYMMATVENKSGVLDINLTAYCVKDSEGEYYSKSTKLSEDDYIVLEEDLYMDGAKVPSVTGQSPIAYYGTESVISDCENGIWRTACKDLSYEHSILDGTFNIYDYERRRYEGGFRFFSAEDDIYAASLSYVEAASTGEAYYDVRLFKFDTTSLSDGWQLVMDSYSGPIYGSEKTWTEESVIQTLGLGDNGLLHELGECQAVMNSDSHQLSCDSDTFEDAFGHNTLYGDIVEANVLQWNEQLSKELPMLRAYYNTEMYFGTNDNLKLKKRIVAEVLSGLYWNCIDESQSEDVEDSVFTVLAPYEYEFIYTCNAQNPSQIYSSSREVVVESTVDPSDEMWKITQTGNNGVREQLWICTAWDTADSTEHIYGVWQYYLTYDKDDLLNDVNVIRMYVLPYINDDGYWCINNVDTDIYARGKDGGQPSIIISYSDTYTGQHEILSTMNADELSTALDWKFAYFKVRPLDTSTTIGSDSFHLMTTYMPINISTAYLHENLVTFLENAIIMDVSSVHNEVESDIRPLKDPMELGDNATITTFWALKKDKESGEYAFSYVKQPNTSWAVDFNYLTDAEAIVKYYMQMGLQPDVYRHRWLVFNGVEASLKNQSAASETTMVYPTWKNNLRDSFADMFDIESEDMYLNNLNFMLAFYNDIEWNGSYIANVNDENIRRFFKFDKYEETDDEGYTVSYYYVPTSQLILDADTKTLANEWYPNTRIANSYDGTKWWNDTLLPILDLKETFIRDVNVLNRYNILTTSCEGRMYYSYIGSTPDSADKSVVHIGTGTTVLNLGLKTLTDKEERTKFEMNSEIDIDFPTIVLNGDVIMPKSSWDVYQQEGSEWADNKMYQTHYEMAYIMVGEPHTFNSLEDVVQATPDVRDRYFRIPKDVSLGVSDIGGGHAVDGKTTYVSYVNVNWLCQNVFKIAGFTNEKLRAEDNYSCFAYGEAGRLFWLHDTENTPSYFLQLTTDLLDNAEILYDYDAPGSEQKVYFIKPNSLDVSYLARYSRRGTPTHIRVNIRESSTTHSTAYSMYDGGELEWED